MLEECILLNFQRLNDRSIADQYLQNFEEVLGIIFIKDIDYTKLKGQKIL